MSKMTQAQILALVIPKKNLCWNDFPVTRKWIFIILICYIPPTQINFVLHEGFSLRCGGNFTPSILNLLRKNRQRPWLRQVRLLEPSNVIKHIIILGKHRFYALDASRQYLFLSFVIFSAIMNMKITGHPENMIPRNVFNTLRDITK